MTHRHHAGAIDIAVVVDETLAVAQQVALALQAAVEEFRVLVAAVVAAGVVRLDGIGELDAGRGERFLDDGQPADQHRLAETHVVERIGGAGDLRLLAFGEDDALGRIAHLGEDAAEPARHRIEPGGKLGNVAIHVDDRLARHARFHGRLGDGRRHVRDEPGIERGRNDVVGPVGDLPAEERGRDLVRHVLAGEFSQRIGRGDLHGLVDGRRLHVERAAEDEGEAQHVVDLVRIVRAAGCHDRIGAHLGHFFRRDFRVRIGHGKDDRLVRHRRDHLLGDRAGRRETEERIGAVQRIGQRRALVSTAKADFHWFMPSLRPR